MSAEGVLSGARILARLGAEVSGRIWPVPGHLSYRSWQLALVSLTRLAVAGRAMTDVEAWQKKDIGRGGREGERD